MAQDLWPPAPASADARVIEWMAGQHGLVSRAQALAAGLTEKQVAGRVRAGRWVRAARGVYRHAAVTLTPQSALLAACMAHDALASHRSAAALHGIDDYGLDRLEVVVAKGRVGRIPGVRLHRSTQMALARPVVRDGIPCTGLRRTVLDLAAVVTRKQLDRTIDAVLRDRLLRRSDLYSVLAIHSCRGRTGCGLLRAALDALGEDPVPLSEWSRMVAELLVSYGLDRPDFEYRVLGRDGSLVAQVDLAYPSTRLAIELDSVRWHFNRASFKKDPRRRNAMFLSGWNVLTFTWDDYANHPAALCATVAEACSRAA